MTGWLYNMNQEYFKDVLTAEVSMEDKAWHATSVLRSSKAETVSYMINVLIDHFKQYNV